ncbi:outer membrane efflux protein [Ferriphaselus amnicola]|uniref:Outer membrane efflux protein n=1 Tax=Ferriphaselus amnicola TaxID=1188319 RepID=A0A2Z6G9M3_9PROT|nr:TolC family protein [Ferriphaselus amnicola]BBE50187.1 outer membrane efflux protein [Ferriphaselus amnicola]
MKPIVLALALAFAAPIMAEEISYPDLPPPAQAEAAISRSITVLTAESGIKFEQSNRRRWSSGNYEFNVRAGSAQRRIASTGQALKEWDVAIERPVRLPNKMLIDQEIGAEGVQRAEFTLGDARHEAGRLLLRLWFTWQREQAQVAQWQQQELTLQRLAAMTEKRVKAGDAPKMEHNQALAAAAQAGVSRRQALMRAQLAANEIVRQFPGLELPENVPRSTPQAIQNDFTYWKDQVFQHNHELGMVRSDRHLQQLLAQRSRADRIPDPTVGMRYSSEMAGNEKVTGVYVSVPLSFGLRSAQAEGMQHQAEIATNREAFVQRRLEGDVYATHTQAVSSFTTWQQAADAGNSIRQNAELVARAYALGESSLSDTLTARRIALESTLAEATAQLDANEARYRLLLDAHQLWPLDSDEDVTHDHY